MWVKFCSYTPNIMFCMTVISMHTLSSSMIYVRNLHMNVCSPWTEACLRMQVSSLEHHRDL